MANGAAQGFASGEPTYQAVAPCDKTAAVVVLPKLTTVLSPMAETAPTQRDHHIKVYATYAAFSVSMMTAGVTPSLFGILSPT